MGKAIKSKAEITLGDGDYAVTIDGATLQSIVPGDDTDRGNTYTKQGVVLVDRRIREQYVTGPAGPNGEPGTPFKVTASLFISREPLNDDERAECNATAEEQAQKKADRDAQEQAKREREITAAVERSQEQLVGVFTNLDKFQRAASAMVNRK